MQRLIAALSAPTAEGILYDVDARLRPAGGDGPLAAQLQGFYEYHRTKSWAWEHMSLIRSRLIHAKPDTAKSFETEISGILSRERKPTELAKEMLEMRTKVEKQFGSKDPWDMKYRKGGLMDIMFAVHFLVLKNAHKHKGLLLAHRRRRNHGTAEEKADRACRGEGPLLHASRRAIGAGVSAPRGGAAV